MSRTALLVQTLIVVILGSLAAWVVLRAKQGPRPERLAPKLMAAPAHDQPVGESPPPTPDQADKESAQHFLAAAQAANAGHEPWVTPAGAVNRICAEMVEGLAEGPVTAIWLFDRTESAERLRSDVSAELGVALGNVAQLPVLHGRHGAKPAVQDAAASPGSLDSARLLQGVCSYADKLHLGLGTLSGDMASVQAELKRLSTDGSGKEMTFTAIKESFERLVPASLRRRQTIMVVITDEIGDDADQVDAVVELAKREGIAIFVIGPSAPFGRDDTLGIGRDTENLEPVRRGPETIARELLELDDTEITGDLYKFDSGFGPFALARLCQASGGEYLRIDPQLRSTRLFPIEGIQRLDAQKMSRYRPDYLSQTEFVKLLARNAACRSLVEATRQPSIPIRQELKFEFTKSNDVELKRALDEAQRAVARIEPKLRQLWTILIAGKADRDAMPSARWKASYDLAVGRLLATRCRVEGYNIACAQLKQGRAQGVAEHRTWVLTPSDEGLGDSSLERMIKDARAQLERVQAEHPETPWALMAARELQAPLGWKWQDR